MVLPAVDHEPDVGSYSSELVPVGSFTSRYASTARTLPVGSSTHPSSSFSSNLPVPVGVHDNVDSLNSACCRVQQLASIKVLLNSTIPEASPMVLHPLGGLTVVQVL